MLTFKKYLTEILDSKTELKLVRETNRSMLHELDLGNGNIITFVTAAYDPEWWKFYFKGEDADGNETFDLTGKGDQFKIFAASKQILNHLIQKHAPKKIEIEGMKSAGSSKRSDLYRKFLAKYTPPQYKVEEIETPQTVYFNLVRKTEE